MNRLGPLVLALLGGGLTLAAQEQATEPSLADVPPALAQTLRHARAEAEQLAATSTDASDRGAAWGNLGMLYHAQRLRHLAQGAYDRAVAEAGDPRWHYLRAIVQAERGDIASSIADLRIVIAAQPANVPARYRLGVALLLTGDIDGAAEELREAARRAPESALMLVALADVATARRDFAAARTLLESAWQLEPEAGQIAYKLAMTHRALGDAEAAASWLARRPSNSLAPTIDDPLLLEVAKMSRSARFYEVAADWALARGDRAAALAALRSAVAVAPDDVAVGLRLASLLGTAGERDQAIAETRRLLARDADSAQAWYLLAWLLRESAATADAASAATAAARSLKLAENAKTRALAAALAMRARRFGDAAAHYRVLVHSHPDDAVQHYWLGIASLGAGDCDGRKALIQALRLRKDWGEAHLVLARADAVCGNAAAARERAQALRRAKDDVDTRLTLAFAELGLGRTEQAQQLASAELPHSDAVLLLDAVAAPPAMLPPFAADSGWWLPPAVR